MREAKHVGFKGWGGGGITPCLPQYNLPTALTTYCLLSFHLASCNCSLNWSIALVKVVIHLESSEGLSSTTIPQPRPRCLTFHVHACRYMYMYRYIIICCLAVICLSCRSPLSSLVKPDSASSSGKWKGILFWNPQYRCICGVSLCHCTRTCIVR